MGKMTDEKAFDMARELRDAGYTVAIWTPEETVGVSNTNHLLDCIIELGNEAIEALS